MQQRSHLHWRKVDMECKYWLNRENFDLDMALIYYVIRFMMAPKIERVDTIPLIIAILEKMGVQTEIVRYDTTSFNVYHADCKAAALETCAAIDHEKGYYLFPLPMTGETLRRVKELVLNPGQTLQDIMLAPKQDHDDGDRMVGKGFFVTQQMEVRLENGAVHRWQERWMVSYSHAHAQHQEKSFQNFAPSEHSHPIFMFTMQSTKRQWIFEPVKCLKVIFRKNK